MRPNLFGDDRESFLTKGERVSLKNVDGAACAEEDKNLTKIAHCKTVQNVAYIISRAHPKNTKIVKK